MEFVFINVFVIIKCSSQSFVFLKRYDCSRQDPQSCLNWQCLQAEIYPIWEPSVIWYICRLVVWGLCYFVPFCFYNLCQQENQTGFFFFITTVLFLSLWIWTQRWPLFISISFISWNSPRFKLCHKLSIFWRKNALHFQTKLFCLKDCNNYWNVIRQDYLIQDIKKTQVSCMV